MDEKKLREHQRINDILLGPLERPALAWLARKMPHWVMPDTLTGIGVFASVIIFVSYWLTTYNKNFLWLASFGFILNWFGDSLDGTLARYRKIERPRYGFFIDHTIDAVSEILIFVGIGLSPYVDLTVALFGLIAYFNISILVYLIMIARGYFQISLWKIGPTEFRVLAILANVVVYFIGNPSFNTMFGAVSLYNAVVVFLIVLLIVFFFYEAIHTGGQLAREDDYSRQRREQKEQLKLERRKNKALEEQMRKEYKARRKARLEDKISDSPTRV
jgi:phosphatidylglycerophosphate synthase